MTAQFSTSTAFTYEHYSNDWMGRCTWLSAHKSSATISDTWHLAES